MSEEVIQESQDQVEDQIDQEIPENNDDSADQLEAGEDSGDDNQALESADEDGEPPLPDEDPELQDEQKKKDFILKRKEKQLRRVQEENAVLQRQMHEAQSSPPVLLPQNAALQGVNAPVRSDYDSDDEYLDARLDYRDAVKYHAEQQKAQQNFRFKMEADRTAKLHQAMENGANKYTDFDDVVAPIFGQGFPRNDMIADAIADSEFKEDILYFMGKNLDRAKNIATMKPTLGVKEIAKLEQRFLDKKKSKKPEKSAHQPMQNIKGVGGAAAEMGMSAERIDKMSQSQYETWRKQHGGKKSVW